MTKAEIRSEVRRRLRESLSNPVFWLDTDIDVAVQEGYDEISDSSEWYETYQTISILEDRPYYDMRTQCRDRFLVLGKAFNETTNRWLTPAVPRDLDLTDNRWERRVSEPERVMVRGIWWVGYWPFKGVATGKIKQYLVGFPPRLDEDDDEPGFDERFHQGLVEYALFDLFAQDSETDLAWAAWKEYERYESMLMADRGKRNGCPRYSSASPISPANNP
jgi:hypothetical protein